MDEPLSNLDAKLRVQMRAEIARLQQDLGVTTIYVTHDQVEAMTMGDRVAVMRKGELQQVADPQTLYDRPVNLFVGGFIGSPAMTEDVRELAQDVGDDRIVQKVEEQATPGATLVGRFGARSRVKVGELIEMAVDTRALHFFDAETGLGIYDSTTKGADG